MILLRPLDPDDDERRYEAQRHADRAADHTPAPATPPQESRSPRITSAMGVLARTVLHGNWHDARDASRALAEMVLEALQ